MRESEFGMCCSEEMANRCADSYNELSQKEGIKESIQIILSIAIPSILFIAIGLLTGTL